jgi:hypothetical protein
MKEQFLLWKKSFVLEQELGMKTLGTLFTLRRVVEANRTTSESAEEQRLLFGECDGLATRTFEASFVDAEV